MFLITSSVVKGMVLGGKHLSAASENKLMYRLVFVLIASTKSTSLSILKNNSMSSRWTSTILVCPFATFCYLIMMNRLENK